MTTQCLGDEILQMFIDATLDPVEQAIVGDHLRRCLGCRVAIAHYKQLMWDLEHPTPEPEPAQSGALYESLMAAWRHKVEADRMGSAAIRQRSLSLLPVWAGYTVMWTRNVPGVGRLRSLVSRRRGYSPDTPFSLGKWLLPRGGGRR